MKQNSMNTNKERMLAHAALYGFRSRSWDLNLLYPSMDVAVAPRDTDIISTPSAMAASNAARMSTSSHTFPSHALYIAIRAAGTPPRAVPLVEAAATVRIQGATFSTVFHKPLFPAEQEDVAVAPRDTDIISNPSAMAVSNAARLKAWAPI
nr:Oxoglutarate/iron-dependent dioxygenase [Ipomoea batatas]